MRTLSLLSTLSILAVSFPGASAYPRPREQAKPSLSFTARFNHAGFVNILEADLARANFLKSASFGRRIEGHDLRRAASFAVDNAAITYTATVGVGTPPTNYTLIIDTGSSNTWVGANKPYVQSSSSIPTGEDVEVVYGGGFFSGSEFLDTVTLSPNLVITKQSIGAANQSQGFPNNTDGILGIGPTKLTANTTSEAFIPTVADNLFASHIIDTETIGIFYAPVNASPSTGELTFGGIDSNKTTSPVHFVPITNVTPSSLFWGIDQSISMGNTTILNSTSGIVDTGTTLLLIASDGFAAYKQATGGVLDFETGLLSLTPDQFNALKPLDFLIGGQTFTLTPNAQIWPRSLNVHIGGKPDSFYLIAVDIGRHSGHGFDFLLGYTFMERFYTVFDTTNSQVGFATNLASISSLDIPRFYTVFDITNSQAITAFTDAETN